MKSYSRMMLRGVKESLTRFLSILCISALGVGFLCGLLSTEPEMKAGADAYYDRQNARDFMITSNLGMTKEDVKALEERDDIRQVQGKYLMDMVVLDDNDETYVARVMGYGFDDEKNIDGLELTSGRWPEAKNECVIEVPNIYVYELEEGVTLTPSNENSNYKDITKALGKGGFKVVGFVMSPQFVSMYGERTTVGDGKIVMGIYVRPEAFDLDYYTALFATASGTEDMNTYDDTYKEYTDGIKDDLKPFGEQRSKARRDALVADATKEYEKAKREYESEKADATAKLVDAKGKLDRAYRDIENGEAQIAKAEKDLAANGKKLDQAEKELAANKEQIDQLKAMQAQGYPLPPEAVESIKAYDKGVAEAAAGRKQLAKGRATLDSKKKDLEKGRAEYRSGLAEYQRNKAKADEEFAEAEGKLAKAKKDIQKIAKGKWTIMTRRDVAGISSYEDDAEKIGAIAKVFPVFFFLVALLVAMTTMTRLMDEERMRIGTLKSLGYSNFKILSYYLRYSLVASLLGCLIGVPMGSMMFPKVISNAYKMMYVLPPLKPTIRWEIDIPVSLVLVGMILTVTAVSCLGMLRGAPAALLQPRAPKAGKRILLEYIGPLWRHLPFSRKVTLRNLFRYKKRFLMTVLGVAGCFALLLTGFGVRDSIRDIVDLQYGEIFRFDNVLELEYAEAVTKDKVIREALADKGLVTGHTELTAEDITLVSGDVRVDATLAVPQDTDTVKDYVTLRERVGHKDVALTDDGAVVTEKASEKLDLSVGDTVTVRNGDREEVEVTITGITENYVGSYLYMTPAVYKELYGEPPDPTTVWIKAKDGRYDDVNREMFKSGATSYIYDNETVIANFSDSVSSIDYIVLVLIVSAGALAIIVLYSLTNINICERKKELATIEVLGFYPAEVRRYIFREVNILTFLGCLVGIPAGILLHSFVIHTAEVEGIMFGRLIYWPSYIYAAAITLVFAFAVNLIMRRTIGKIDMVESMKAVD